jgi:hypothetical protein
MAESILIIVLSVVALWSILKSLMFDYKSPDQQPNQYTWVYCECGNELCSDGSYEGTYLTSFDTESVRYICKKCGEM